MRAGNILEANELSSKIGKLINEYRRSELSKVSPTSSKQLWKLVNEARSPGQSSSPLKINGESVDIEALNHYFADIATDPTYDPRCCQSYINDYASPVDQASCIEPRSSDNLQRLNVMDVLSLLATVTKTSPGLDNIPYWFFRNCCYQIAPVVTYIFNLTLSSGKPPLHWKKAIITPVPKVSKPASFSDFRPISVTPLLSRILERLIVKRYLLPSLPATAVADQYAYRHSGSTTAAVVEILHRVTHLLETNKYVRCIFFDFSKAFDTVNHPILFSKLKLLPLPPTIMTWIVNFLSGRTQAISHDGSISTLLPITRSIVQGSGLGPALYITYKSDLHPLSDFNFLVKFADDTTAIIPQSSDVSAYDEVQHIRDWASENKLNINLAKTKEIVFCKSRFHSSNLPPPILGIEQVTSVKSLGVILSQHLKMDDHVNSILSIITQRFYLLNQLRKLGLPMPALNCIFHALILSRIIYALPAFSGFLSATNTARLDAALRRARRWDLTDKLFTVNSLIEETDFKLFRKIQNAEHCLHHLLPALSYASQSSYDLRPRGHPFTLTPADTLFKNSFITRSLYKYK